MLLTDQSSLSWPLIALVAFALLLVFNSYRRLTKPPIPTLNVALTEGDDHASAALPVCSKYAVRHHVPLQPVHAAEAQDTIAASKYTPSGQLSSDTIPCYDPGNMQFLGHLPAMDSAQASIVLIADVQLSILDHTDMYVYV